MLPLLRNLKGLGPLVTWGCFLWMLLPVCSTVHFFVFYAFWHCICLGMAELWGFPDRNLYGEHARARAQFPSRCHATQNSPQAIFGAHGGSEGVACCPLP